MSVPRRRRGKGPDDEERAGPAASAPAIGATLRAQEDGTTDRLLREAGPDPDRIAAQLESADPGAQTRALARLQGSRGNGFVQDVVRAMAVGGAGHVVGQGAGAGRTTVLTVERSADAAAARLDVQRDAEAPEEAEALDVSAGGGATESIGPAVESTWSVAAANLADAAAAISGRPEAGQVGWSLDMKYTATKGPIDSVAVTAAITLEMPEWTPPPAMLPKAKAEWARWYAALRAHEQGHIDLVHAHMDGLAKQLLGKSGPAGEAVFAAAKAKLSKESKAYDKRTDHGRNAGTIMDVSIEEREIEEARKLEEAKKKAAKASEGEGAPSVAPDGGTGSGE